MRTLVLLPIVAVISFILSSVSSGKQQDPNLGTIPDKTRTIEGVEFSVLPSKPVFIQNEPYILNINEYIQTGLNLVFGENEPVKVVVRAHNTTNEARFLGVSKPRESDGVQMKTIVQIDGNQVEVNGIPCYIHVQNDTGWDARICQAGYSDHYRGIPLLLSSGEMATFEIDVPNLSSKSDRTTGKFFIFSRFSVAKTTETLPVIANGPAASFLIVDANKATDAAAKLTNALNGLKTDEDQIVRSVITIRENPIPEYSDLIVKVIRYNWPFKNRIEIDLWSAAMKFISQDIYDIAVAEAKRPDIDKSAAQNIYSTIWRNQKYLRREDVLTIIDNPRLNEDNFLNFQDFNQSRNNGFYPTLLLSLVATEDDIPRLAEMCSNFMPVRIGHDLAHSSYNNRLDRLHETFSRYPDASRESLRKALQKGMVPSQFKPWSREFGLGQIPEPLIIIAEWLAEMKDVDSIPIFEYYAEHQLVRVSNTMQSRAPEWIAQIDGPEAMKALRRIGSDRSTRGIRERAKLGDPAAIDRLLSRARGLYGRPIDDTGESMSLFRFVFAIMEPETKQELIYPDAVEQLWKEQRPEFVEAFIKKYGFDPDA